MRTFILATVIALAGCQSPRATRALPRDEAKQLLLDRNWIDRLPQKVDDKLHVFRFVPKMGGGVFQDRTIFFGTFELFQFSEDGETIEFALLHTGDRAKTRFTIEAIEPARKGDVDLKLTLVKSPRGPSVYYGWRREAADLDGELAGLVTR
jgi:hypothetical protein